MLACMCLKIVFPSMNCLNPSQNFYIPLIYIKVLTSFSYWQRQFSKHHHSTNYADISLNYAFLHRSL